MFRSPWWSLRGPASFCRYYDNVTLRWQRTSAILMAIKLAAMEEVRYHLLASFTGTVVLLLSDYVQCILSHSSIDADKQFVLVPGAHKLHSYWRSRSTNRSIVLDCLSMIRTVLRYVSLFFVYVCTSYMANGLIMLLGACFEQGS